MDADLSSLPDDLDALKAALIAARTEAAAEKACAVAAVAELAQGRALIAHLNLEIEKLRRAIYGPRSGVNAGARLHRFPEQRCINNVDENALEHGLGSWASGWGHIVFGRVGVVAA